MRYRGFQLDAFQQQAINHLRSGSSVLVAAPTGTGKTIIADWMVDEALATGKRIIYTAPIKALSNQKFRDYTKLHGESKVGLVTGDLVIRREAPCLVMTTEILRNMLLTGDNLEGLVAVVLDEIHFLDDRERGTVWEEVLIYLPKRVLIIGLSATLSNLSAFGDWLADVRKAPVEIVKETTRNVPLQFWIGQRQTGLLSLPQFDVAYRKHQQQQAKLAHTAAKPRDRFGKRRSPGGRKRRFVRHTHESHIFWMLHEKDLLPYLYFAFSRRDTERFARNMARELTVDLLTPQESESLNERLQRARTELGPELDRELLRMYSQGIAYHHAGLHVQLKALVEELYECKLIKVLYCTSTFALGINMPARTVVLDGLRMFDGRQFSFLTVRNAMQIAGRAGRRGLDERGHVVFRLDMDDYAEALPYLKRYQQGQSEPVRSSFNLSWNSVINLIETHDQDHCRTIVERSFLNYNLSEQASRQLEQANTLEEQADSRKSTKKARRLRRRAEAAGSKCWSDFQSRITFLCDAGYLANDLRFNAGAKALRHLQMTEILVTELVLQGVFDALEPTTLFGVLCSLVASFPRKAWITVALSKTDRQLVKRIEAIRQNPIVVAAEDLTQVGVEWSPPYLVLGREWARGQSLQAIVGMVRSDTDVAGDLVSAFRRAKDLASQLKGVYADLPEQADTLALLIRNVSRDEVEVVG